jgi:hypothetical protein
MKYTEEELTEATKFIDYLRSIQRYAIVLLALSSLYSAFRLYQHADSHEIYLLAVFVGVLALGSLSVIIRIHHKTAITYGLSCVVGTGVFFYTLFLYGHTNPDIITATGIIVGLLVIRHAVQLVFGKRSQVIFSQKNQKKIAFVSNLITSLKHSHPGDKDVIHCNYISDDKSKKMKIQFLENVACFLLNGQRSPLFFDRDNIALFELRDNGDLLRVSVVADNHDWLEADLKRADFKKYQKWKDR